MTRRERPHPRWQRLRVNASRANLRRGVIILPSAFTLGNLFFGFYAIVSAVRGNFTWAAWCIVIAATLDYLDGRVARVTRTGSDFGRELDSLTDAVSFGVAPSFILFLLYFQESDWGWMVGFVYVAAVVLRLARFNVEQGGQARSYFLGLPTPGAAVLLTSHYPFSQTALVQQHAPGLPWNQVMGIATVLIMILMVSHIPYAKMPRLRLDSRKGVAQSALLVGGLGMAVTVPWYWFFPSTVTYALWGLGRSVLLGHELTRERVREWRGRALDESDVTARKEKRS